MSTKSRLGIDITATDRTAAAFASVQKSMSGIKRSFDALKFLMAGFVGGNMLASMVKSFVDIAKQTEPVKTAFDNLELAWTKFGQKVGEGGLNQALIGFADRINAMISGTDGLSASIGAFLGGAINGMGALFEGIGRAIAFAYDNAELFGRLLAGMAVVVFAQQIIRVAIGFYYLAKTVRETGIIMTAFQAISRANLLVFLALAAGVAYATDSMDQLKQGIDSIWQKVKEVFPMLTQKVSGAMEGLGVDMSALSGNLADAVKYIDKAGTMSMPTLGKAATSAANGVRDFAGAFNDAADAGGRAVKGMGSALDGLTSIGDTIGSSFQQAFEGIISGTKSVKEAATEMVSSIVSQVSNMLVSSAIKQLISLLQSGLGGGSGGGFLSTLLGGLAGARADGGPVMAGQSYLVGERGPEIFRPGSSGAIIPNGRAAGGSRMNVNVHISTPDSNSFQRSRTQVASIITRAVAQGQRNL